MADAELAPDGGEALEIAPEEQVDETPEAIANLAKDLGWTPQDQWQGEPDKWKPAEQFIRDGREIQQTTSRELRGLREQVERMGNVTSQIITDKLAERDAEWQQRMAKAVDDGDTETALKLADQRPTAQPASNGGADPHVASWVAKNPWFTSDPLAEARARELSERLKHLPVPEQLAQVERAIRKEYPELFPKAKDPPSTQTGATRSTGPNNRVKGFADMPAESQRMARDFNERHPDTKLEDIAKSYWAQEGVSR